MKKTDLEKYMHLAIKEARKNIKSSWGGPFGACIIRKGEVLASARNTVLKNDCIAHAEINAIRRACKKVKTFDLSGCVIFSTTEPCPMCFGAIHWARIGAIYYGTKIADVRQIGFNELNLSNKSFKRLVKSPIKIYSKVSEKSCKELLGDWVKFKKHLVY